MLPSGPPRSPRHADWRLRNMDEPFSALDALLHLRMRDELLRMLARERHTVV